MNTGPALLGKIYDVGKRWPWSLPLYAQGK